MNILFKYKKIFLALALLLAAAIFGYLIYFLFFYQEPRPTSPSETATSGPEAPGGLPEAGEGEGQEGVSPGEGGLPSSGEVGEGEEGREEGEEEKEEADETARGGVTRTTTLNDTPALDPVLGSNGRDIQYYNQENGKFYQIDKNGNTTLMSDKVFHNVEKVNWAPDKNKAILEYPDGSNIVYDFESEKQVTLPKHWQDFDFSPDSKQIVMESIGKDPENRWLAISNTQGGDITPIEEVGNNYDSVYPNWSPNHQMVAMYTEGKDFNRQEVYFLGKNEENFKSITVEGRGFQPKWSQEGDKLLYSVYSSDNNMNPQLWSTNAKGEKVGTDRQSLGVNTWAEKCTFSSNTEVYCGVPKELPEGAGLFPELAQDSSDRLYKIDIKSGTKQLVATPDKDYNISNIQISEDESTLFFTDSKTQKIHKMDLR